MGVGAIGAGAIAAWAGKKALSLALSKAQTAATQKFTDVAKNKVGNALFGQNINGVGEAENKLDFRGHARYKAPAPGGIVKFFCGSSVIDSDTLNDRLLDQAKKAYDEQQAFENKVNKPEAPAEGEGAEPQPEAGPDPKDAKVEKPVNTPITLETFKTMVNPDEHAKNKGYVRFVKCDGGQGVTLGKVGNKVGYFMSWRVNVTAEHNRQMRQLLAETLLSDFGGADNIVADPQTPSKYGAFLDEKLNSLKVSILNSQIDKTLLKRTEVRQAIKDYESLFTKESKEQIINSCLTKCLDQCQYVEPDGDPAVRVTQFLKEYGSHAGVKDLPELVEAAREAKTGAALRVALESITVAFDKMNEAWQQDKAAKSFLQTIAEDKTSAVKLNDGPKLNDLKGAVLRRLQDETWPEVEGKTLNHAETVNQFFADGKVFDTLVRHLRGNRERAIENGKPEAEADRDFRDKLELMSIVAEVRAYGAKLNQQLAEQKSLTAIEVIRDAKTTELKGYLLEKSDKSSRLGYAAELAELDKKIETVEKELEWLDTQEKLFNQDEAPKEIKALLDEKDIGKDEKKLQEWSRDALNAVLKDGYKALDRDFHVDYITDKYLEEKCPELENEAGKSVQETMARIVDNFKAVVTKALAANVRDAGDIKLTNLIEELGDFLMSDILEDGLKNDAVQVMDQNPYKPIHNTIRTSPQIFVENVMRVSVEHALAKKVEKGVAFSEMKGQLKDRVTVVGKKLAKLFAAIATKDSKLKGFRSYVSDVRVFKQTGVIPEAQWQSEKAKYRDGARNLLRITLLDPFLNDDLPELLEEGDENFEKKAQARLDWRVQELMTAFKAMNVQQFYEGALHFDTLQALTDHSMHALFGLPVKDVETGFTDPQRVGMVFRNTLDVVNRDRRTLLGGANRPSFVLADVDIAPLFQVEAEKKWRQNVVAHAPGGFSIHIFNTIREKLQDFLNVPLENRQKDIGPDWLDNRSASLKSNMTAFMKDYLDFEKDVVRLCRAEMTKVLASVGGATFNGVHDPAVRARLVDDVLGSFKGSIGTLLKRYLEHPEAMVAYLKGDKTRLAGLVHEALGLGKDPQAPIAESAGAKEAARALDIAVRNRADIVNGRLAKPDLQVAMVNELLNANTEDKKITDLKALSDAVSWAVKHALDYARMNPVDAYTDEVETFQANLIARAQKDLQTVVQPYVAQIGVFQQKLQAALDARKAKLDANPALVTFATNAQAESETLFTNAFCNLAVSRSKDKNAYRNNLEALVEESVATFAARVDEAIDLAADRQVAAFKAFSQAFDEARRNAETALTLPGVSMESLVLLRKQCDNVWKDVNAKFGAKVTSVTTSQQEIDDALFAAKDELAERIKAITDGFTARLAKSESILSDENLAATLAHFGITPEAYPDAEAFKTALASLANNPTVIGFFHGMQEIALKNELADVPSIRDSANWENTFVPGFKADYERAVLDAKVAVFVRENAPAVIEALFAQHTGYVALQGMGERTQKTVDANRNTLENAVKVWMREFFTAEKPETWKAKLAETFGDPLGSKAPKELAQVMEDANNNFQMKIRMDDLEPKVKERMRDIRKTTVKHLFVKRLTGSFESQGSAGTRRYARMDSRISPLGPVAAVDTYSRLVQLSKKQAAAVARARKWAVDFEKKLADALDEMNAQLMKGVADGSLEKLPGAEEAYAIVDRIAAEMKKAEGNDDFTDTLLALNEEIKKTEKKK